MSVKNLRERTFFLAMLWNEIKVWSFSTRIDLVEIYRRTLYQKVLINRISNNSIGRYAVLTMISDTKVRCYEILKKKTGLAPRLGSTLSFRIDADVQFTESCYTLNQTQRNRISQLQRSQCSRFKGKKALVQNLFGSVEGLVCRSVSSNSTQFTHTPLMNKQTRSDRS